MSLFPLYPNYFVFRMEFCIVNFVHIIGGVYFIYRLSPFTLSYKCKRTFEHL